VEAKRPILQKSEYLHWQLQNRGIGGSRIF